MSATPRPWTWDTHEAPRAYHVGMDARMLPSQDYGVALAAVNREPLLEEARRALEFLLASNALGDDCNNPRYDGGDEWVTNVDAFRHAKAVLATRTGRAG